MAITPVDWPASGTLRVSPLPTRRDIFRRAFWVTQIGHARPLAPTQSSPAASSDPGAALSNVAHAQLACLTWTWFNGPNLEKFAVVIASSNSPNSKLQTSLARLDIFNSEQHS